MTIGRIMLMLAALMLGGCASIPRDRTLAFQCPELADAMQRIPFDLTPDAAASAAPEQAPASAAPPPAMMADGGGSSSSPSSAAPPASGPPSPALTAAMLATQQQWSTSSVLEQDGKAPPPPAVLLLSGGGQWGAFGAGFLRAVHESGGVAAPTPRIVTGISTGAIQTLFVAAQDYDGLVQAYTGQPEQAYARSRSTLGALINGSRASFAPLRTLLMRRLTGSDGGPLLLRAIARNTRERADGTRPIYAFIGMVDAASGDFVEVDLAALVQALMPDPDAAVPPHAAECVTAVAMASSAIPVTFERVAIRTSEPAGARPGIYYDGGVRQSVFFSAAAKARALALTGARDEDAAQALPFYVIRNGPSTAREEPAILREHDILSAAMRGYSLLVNQNEVMSVCALRLVNPDGPILLQTADGYRSRPDMAAGPDRSTQFDVPFMHRLAALGDETGRSASGRWMLLQPLAHTPGAPFCRVTPQRQG